MENRILIGVSGGPDSMYLLNKLRKEQQHEIFVVHVNYHLREESDYDMNLVVDYCKKYSIKCFILNVTKEDWKEVSFLKNKQSMAREIRYKFYLKLSKENNISELYLGHHKDDFLETAIMQSSRSDDYLFYGIKSKSFYKDLLIIRPLLNMYKNEIINFNNKNTIPYVLDKTNDKPIYERNKIRLELKTKSIEEKNLLFEKYININSIKKTLEEEINLIYDNWDKSNFEYNIYINIKDSLKKYIIYKFLINSNTRINISKDKINGIIEFLKNKSGNKEFRLMNNIFLVVKSNIIKISIK